MTLPLWLLAAAVIVAVILVFIPRIRRELRERKLARKLLALGIECRHGVILKDVLDEGIYLDYLVFMPDRIVLLDIKRYRGNIFAAPNMDMWTQVIGRRSFKFPNPLHKIETDVAAISSLVPGQLVEGYIVFSRDGKFPKGTPAGVLSLDDALQLLTVNQDSSVAQVQTRLAWEKLIVRLGVDKQR